MAKFDKAVIESQAAAAHEAIEANRQPRPRHGQVSEAIIRHLKEHGPDSREGITKAVCEQLPGATPRGIHVWLNSITSTKHIQMKSGQYSAIETPPIPTPPTDEDDNPPWPNSTRLLFTIARSATELLRIANRNGITREKLVEHLDNMFLCGTSTINEALSRLSDHHQIETNPSKDVLYLSGFKPPGQVPSFFEGIGEDAATRAERHLLRALEEVQRAKTRTLTLRNPRTKTEVTLEFTIGEVLEFEVF